MKFDTLFKFLYIPLALITVVIIVTVPLSFIIVGFAWAPLFVSFVCIHYLLHQRSVLAGVLIPKFIKVLQWIGIILSATAFIFVGLIILATLVEGPGSPDGSSAAWALLAAPFTLIPGVLATIAFFFFKFAALADIRKEQQLQTADPIVTVTNTSTFSYVQITRYAFLLLILVGSLVYALEYYDYINLFGTEKTYTIQSPEFTNNNSIFYIYAKPQSTEDDRPYLVTMQAKSDKLDKRVGYVGNWMPSLLLYHDGILYSLFNNQQIAGVRTSNLRDSSRTGGKGYTPSNKDSFDGDLVIIGEQVYVFEFLDSTCQRGVYKNCRGKLYPVGFYSQNYLQFQSRADEIASYQEFESSSRQSHQYLMIQNGTLVPGNSSLFDKVSKDFEIVPIVTDSGIPRRSAERSTRLGLRPHH